MSKWTKRIAKMALGVMVVGMLAGCGSSASGTKAGSNYTGSWWAETRDSVTGNQVQILTVNVKPNGDNFLIERIVETSRGTNKPETATATIVDGVLRGGGIELTYVVDEKVLLMPWAMRDNSRAKIRLKKSDSNTEAEKTAIRNRPDWKNRI